MASWKDNPIELYRVFVEEEFRHSDVHEKRIRWFVGLISALLGGVVVGLFRAEEWYEFAFLAIGPLLISATAYLAVLSSRSIYNRFIISVTMRAKLEQALGMTEPVNAGIHEGGYWPAEPLVFADHLESRRKHTSSKQWFDDVSPKGFSYWCTFLFRGCQLLGIAMLVAIALLAVFSAAGAL